jgi:tripartite-type tricarboxylate transporter receptor subunit TctC
MGKALKSASVQERLQKLGMEPMQMDPAAFAARVKQEIADMSAFAKKAGMKAN